jgi:DNA-binding transcriptional LysR family regulator
MLACSGGACPRDGGQPSASWPIRYVSGETGAVLAAGAVALVPRLGLAGPPPGIEVLPVADAAVRRRVFAAYRRGSAGRPSVALLLDRLGAAAAGCGDGVAAGHGDGLAPGLGGDS